MSAYYQSCDAFPVAMVTGIDLQDEECAAIMKRVSMNKGNRVKWSLPTLLYSTLPVCRTVLQLPRSIGTVTLYTVSV